MEKGDFTDIKIGDRITLTTTDGENFTGTVKSIDGMDAASWSVGNGRVTITLDDGNDREFYHNKLQSYNIDNASTKLPIPMVATDIFLNEEADLDCIKDESFTGKKFGDMTLGETQLYKSDIKFIETLEKMKALHDGLIAKNTSNSDITTHQCQTIVEQIMETDTNLDVLIEYLVELPKGHFKKEIDGDIVYTFQKQNNYLVQPKQYARGAAGDEQKRQDQLTLKKGLFAKGIEYDGCIFLSNREDKGEKNIIVLTKDGKIIGLTAGGNMFGRRDYKKKQIVLTDGRITDIQFETATSVSRNVSNWGSSWGSTLKRAPILTRGGRRRTRRKSKKSSTRKRGGGRCRESCKKASKKRK
jgi:hypothetical protein